MQRRIDINLELDHFYFSEVITPGNSVVPSTPCPPGHMNGMATPCYAGSSMPGTPGPVNRPVVQSVNGAGTMTIYRFPAIVNFILK